MGEEKIRDPCRQQIQLAVLIINGALDMGIPTAEVALSASLSINHRGHVLEDGE